MCNIYICVGTKTISIRRVSPEENVTWEFFCKGLSRAKEYTLSLISDLDFKYYSLHSVSQISEY